MFLSFSKTNLKETQLTIAKKVQNHVCIFHKQNPLKNYEHSKKLQQAPCDVLHGALAQHHHTAFPATCNFNLSYLLLAVVMGTLIMIILQLNTGMYNALSTHH